MAWVKTQDGTQLYVKEWGNGQGQPLVLIHGWPLSSDSWDDIAVEIAQSGYRVIAYDRRGFGRSEQPRSGYSYDTLASDLNDVLTAYDLSDVVVAGFSMGGGEIARYMTRYAGVRIQKAVLIASVVPYMLKTDDNPHGTPQSVFDQITDGLKADRPHFYAGFFKDFFGVGLLSHPVSDELLLWTRQVAMQGGLQATLDCAAAFSHTDFRPDLVNFHVPTLIIHGTADKTVPIDAAGRAAAHGIAQSQLIEYEGAPHGLTVTHRHRLINDLLAFMRG